ncbi:alpha-ribazole phosphatase [Flavicella marina]|uniref:alpha-ribazole phosphatase n=1 Tax=Flavicella marina TaxID=1475951 RepID=UPI0012649107|nr:alpha-ribazole phosphatase [Flavicella marina]
MEIYLVRHTTPDIEKGICYGQSDLDLADTFEEESKEILEKIPFDQNTKIISSPLKRCTELAKKFNSNYTTDERLLELDFGDWELKNWNAIPKDEITPWMEDFVNVKVPNGESYIDLANRVDTFYKEIIKLKTSCIVVVCHGGVIRSLLAKLTNIELKDSFGIKINYCQVSHLNISTNTSIKIAL